MKNNGKITQMIKSIILSYVVTAIILLILSWITWKMKISVAAAGGGILCAYILSCLLGGFVYSGALNEKRYLGGGLLGLVYFVIVYCVSAVWNQGLVVAMPGMLTAFLICVFSGMLGGMLRSGMR